MLQLFLAILGLSQSSEIALDRDDLEIRRSVRVKAARYRLDDRNDDGLIRVVGDGITIDFQGATLVGSPDEAKPDEFKGWGLVAEGCRNLTVKNLKVRGVKVGMYFKGCDGLRVEGCDVSGNWRQHLKSTPKAEDLSDWLYGHENDRNEWFRYGAGIYVEASKNVTLKANKGRNGQNGICLSRVNDSWVIDNDMSFMSGWGLAMWRSSRNDVSNNKFDWCMRGFSYGVYHRGQDSTGILVYEQCHENVFAYNSATHGGDGFFLYAGNETLERTGEGGCNRNILYRNDFSHAAANGIEATFSDGNQFIENILDECDHGVWAGYSYNTAIVGNKIRNNNNGISIEHGHDNRIEGNEFAGNGTGVNLWWDPDEDLLRKTYGKKRDTASHKYAIVRNRFRGDRVAIRLHDTSDVRLAENEIDASVVLRTSGTCSEIRAWGLEGRTEGVPLEEVRSAEPIVLKRFEPKVPSTRGTLDAFLPSGALRGRRYIFVDDWGPYDFSRVRLFPERATAWETAEFFLLGPEGDFRITGVTGGVQVFPSSSRLPATIKVSSDGASVREFSFTVESGKEKVRASGVLLSAVWDVKFYVWENQGPQRPPRNWEALVEGSPVDAVKLGQVDFKWGGGKPSERVPPSFFAATATTQMDLPAASYELRTVSDDGVRVFVDGRTAIDNWTWHGPTEDRAQLRLEKGKHDIRIEFFQIDGFSQLQLWIEPIR